MNRMQTTKLQLYYRFWGGDKNQFEGITENPVFRAAQIPVARCSFEPVRPPSGRLLK